MKIVSNSLSKDLNEVFSVKRYFEYPHITAIDEKEVEGDEQMRFPGKFQIFSNSEKTLIVSAVTICNVNSNKLSKITEDDIINIGDLFGIIEFNDVSFL